MPGPATCQRENVAFQEQFDWHCQPLESLKWCCIHCPAAQDELELCDEDELLNDSELEHEDELLKDDELDENELEHEDELLNEELQLEELQLEKDELDDEVRTISTSTSEICSSKLASRG